MRKVSEELSLVCGHTKVAIVLADHGLRCGVVQRGQCLVAEEEMAVFVLERENVGYFVDDRAEQVFFGTNGLFRPLFTVPETPDLIFRANLSAFLQLAARQEDPDTLFFNRSLSIEGDTELGLVVKNMLDAMEWPKFSGLPAFRH